MSTHNVMKSNQQIYVEPHIDDSYREYYTVRYNLLVSFPNNGGKPIYGGELLPVEEKMLWIYNSFFYSQYSFQVK